MRPVGLSPDPFGHGLVNHHLNLHLRQEIDHIFGAAIKFGVAFLAAKSLGFENGDALNANFMDASFTSSNLNGLIIASIFFSAHRFVIRLRRVV